MQFNQVSPDVINGTISAVDPAEPGGLTLDSAALIWLRNQSNLMPVVAALQKNKVQDAAPVLQAAAACMCRCVIIATHCCLLTLASGEVTYTASWPDRFWNL